MTRRQDEAGGGRERSSYTRWGSIDAPVEGSLRTVYDHSLNSGRVRRPDPV